WTRGTWVRPAGGDSGLRPGLMRYEQERINALELEVHELRQANEILRKASAFLPRRSSTAGTSPEGLHRSEPGRLRGRADLQGAADRPVDVLRPRQPPGRPGAPTPTLAPGAGAGVADRPGLAREPPDLRGAQGVAPAAPGRRPGGPLHGGTADASGRPAGRGARQAAQVDRPGARGGEADGLGEAPVQGRGYPSALLAQPRGGGMGDPGLGRLA